MAESLAFDLKLVDSVTANAKKAADSLRVVENNAKKAQSALDFSKERGRAGLNLQRLAADPKGYVALIKAQKELRESRNKLLEDAGIKKPESFAQGLMSRFSFAKIAGAAAVGELVAEGAFKVAESLVEGAKMAVEVITDGIKDSFKAAGKEETSRIYERNTLGVEGGKAFREDAARFQGLSPFNDSEIRKLMLPLRRAGLSQAASRQALATATDIGGGDQGAVGSILDQFKNIYTRKGVGRKQLVELLGNVGSTIPDFYKALGAKMHISAKAAEQKAEQGGLDPQLIMNMITEAQNKKQGGPAGTGGKRFADSFEARWKKITELPEEFYKKFADSPTYARASEAVGRLLEQLDPESPAGRRIMESLESAFDKIGGLLGDPQHAADAIASAFEDTIRFVSDLIPDLKVVGGMLLEAADAAADMAFQIRYAKTFTNTSFSEGAKEREALKREGANRLIEKKARELNRFTDQKREERERSQAAMAALTFASGGLAFAPAPKVAGAGGKQVNVTVAPGAVTVHAAPGEDPTHTHQKAGQEVHRHVVNAIERAAAESGG